MRVAADNVKARRLLSPVMVGEGRPSTSLPDVHDGICPDLSAFQRVAAPQDVDARARPEHDEEGGVRGGDSTSKPGKRDDRLMSRAVTPHTDAGKDASR